MNINPAKYFNIYRKSIGFTNQNDAKQFFSGKDITPGIDFNYIENLNSRLIAIIIKINEIVNDNFKLQNVSDFTKKKILIPYNTIKKADLLAKFNNQGRRPEQVLFSWLRGFAIVEYFTPVISQIFDIPLESITQIGDDDLKNIETFRRSPKADLEIVKNDHKIRLEVQSGFQGINDIKEHKIREARKIFTDYGNHSICIHFDLFNGQVAFVQLNLIEDNDVNFITRQQMEGQSVFSIDPNYFKWRLLDQLPSFEELELSL